jgi:hypothetical protein
VGKPHLPSARACPGAADSLEQFQPKLAYQGLWTALISP